MNAPFLICFVLLVFFGVAIRWAIRADTLEAHLLHSPDARCPECEGK